MTICMSVFIFWRWKLYWPLLLICHVVFNPLSAKISCYILSYSNHFNFTGNTNHFQNSHMIRLMTEQTKSQVRPAKTQLSLGIRPVWPEASLSAWRKLGSLPTQWAHSEDWSDWADAQANLSLRWAHSHFVFCWLCHEAANMITTENITLNSLFCLLSSSRDRNCPFYLFNY